MWHVQTILSWRSLFHTCAFYAKCMSWNKTWWHNNFAHKLPLMMKHQCSQITQWCDPKTKTFEMCLMFRRIMVLLIRWYNRMQGSNAWNVQILTQEMWCFWTKQFVVLIAWSCAISSVSCLLKNTGSVHVVILNNSKQRNLLENINAIVTRNTC